MQSNEFSDIKLIQSHVKLLKGSPLFNLSLSSKELFHSNFWAWLWEEYNEQMLEITKHLLTENHETSAELNVSGINPKVEREKNHFDLVLTYNENLSIVIENKIKSLAKSSQLDIYSERIAKKYRGNTICLLISPNKPSFINNGYYLSNNIKWFYISTFQFIQSLKTFNLKDAYHQKLLNDYIYFTEILLKILDIASNFRSLTLKQFNEINKMLHEIRINDIFSKIIFENIANSLYEDFKKQGVKNGISDEDANLHDRIIGFDMGLSGCFVGARILLMIKPDFHLSFYIQGNEFRMFMSGSSEHIIKYFEKIRESKQWFDFSDAIKILKKENDNKIFIGPRLRKNNSKLLGEPVNTYTGKNNDVLHIYKYSYLDENATFNEIYNVMCKYMDNLERSKSISLSGV